MVFILPIQLYYVRPTICCGIKFIIIIIIIINILFSTGLHQSKKVSKNVFHFFLNFNIPVRWKKQDRTKIRIRNFLKRTNPDPERLVLDP